MDSVGGLSDDADVGTIMILRRRDDPVCAVGRRLEAGWEVSLSPIGHGVFADQVEATFDREFMLDPGRLMVLPVPAEFGAFVGAVSLVQGFAAEADRLHGGWEIFTAPLG
jgi:hypothetical protein